MHNFIQWQNEEIVQLTTEQRAFVILEYNKTYSSVAEQKAFRERFPDRNPPAQST